MGVLSTRRAIVCDEGGELGAVGLAASSSKEGGSRRWRARSAFTVTMAFCPLRAPRSGTRPSTGSETPRASARALVALTSTPSRRQPGDGDGELRKARLETVGRSGRFLLAVRLAARSRRSGCLVVGGPGSRRAPHFFVTLGEVE